MPVAHNEKEVVLPYAYRSKGMATVEGASVLIYTRTHTLIFIYIYIVSLRVAAVRWRWRTVRTRYEKPGVLCAMAINHGEVQEAPPARARRCTRRTDAPSGCIFRAAAAAAYNTHTHLSDTYYVISVRRPGSGGVGGARRSSTPHPRGRS